MLNRNTQYYEWLLPYLEGGLDDARRTQLEARLREDPALADEAARLRRTVEGLRAASRQPRPDTAQVPRDLWPRLRAQMGEPAKPAPAPARSAHGWWLTGVGATAAATLALAMVWLPGWHATSLRDLPSQDRPPNASVSSPPGPGRLAGPPPTLVTPTIPPHAAPAMPAVGPKPPTGKQPGKATAPAKVAALPAPMLSVTGGAATDPFALHPAPTMPRSSITPQSSILKPTVTLGGALPDKPAVPLLPHTANQTATRPAAPGGANSSAPGPLTRVFRAPTLLPAPPVQDQPASPPSVTLAAPPALNMNQVQNSAAAGQMIAQGAAPALNATRQAQAEPQTKSQGNVFAMIPLTTPRAANGPGHGVRQDKTTVKRAASASMMENALRAQALGGGGGFPGGGGFGGNAQGGIDAWQSALSAAMQPPLWGDTSGEQQANQALMAAKESGALDDLRARLEARRAQSPKDLVTGRMLAAVYEFGFSKEAALHERRRVADLEGAVGEDWYALAQAEERTGSMEAARAAYRHALECPVPPTPSHAAIARARS